MPVQHALFGEPEIDKDKQKQCDYCWKWRDRETGFDIDQTKADGSDHRCKWCKAEEARLREERKAQGGL